MQIDYRTIFPEAIQAMLGLERAVHASTLESELLELVKIRASQLKGCGFCLDMHTKDAAAAGMSAQRLHLVAAWQEAPAYTPRERAALGWCESLTLISSSDCPDEPYEQVATEFAPEEIVALTLAIAAINGWNRFAVGLRSPVGSHQSHTGRSVQACADAYSPPYGLGARGRPATIASGVAARDRVAGDCRHRRSLIRLVHRQSWTRM